MLRVHTHPPALRDAILDYPRARWSKARCEHGITRREWCTSCEYGSVYDTHDYFVPRSDPAIVGCSAAYGPQYLAASTDDGEDVAYVRSRDLLHFARWVLGYRGRGGVATPYSLEAAVGLLGWWV